MKFKLIIFLVSILSILSSYGMDVNFSLACKAAGSGDNGVVLQYLNNGGDINKTATNSTYTYTLLRIAVEYKDYDLAEILLMRGADPNEGTLLPLFKAAIDFDVRMVKLLLKNNANPNSEQQRQNVLQYLFLHITDFWWHQKDNNVMSNILEITKLILKNKDNPIDLFYIDKFGKTALDWIKKITFESQQEFVKLIADAEEEQRQQKQKEKIK